MNIEHRLNTFAQIYNRNKKAYDFYTGLIEESKRSGMLYEKYDLFKKEQAKAKRRMESSLNRYRETQKLLDAPPTITHSTIFSIVKRLVCFLNIS